MYIVTVPLESFLTLARSQRDQPWSEGTSIYPSRLRVEARTPRRAYRARAKGPETSHLCLYTGKGDHLGVPHSTARGAEEVKLPVRERGVSEFFPLTLISVDIEIRLPSCDFSPTITTGNLIFL